MPAAVVPSAARLAARPVGSAITTVDPLCRTSPSPPADVFTVPALLMLRVDDRAPADVSILTTLVPAPRLIVPTIVAPGLMFRVWLLDPTIASVADPVAITFPLTLIVPLAPVDLIPASPAPDTVTVPPSLTVRVLPLPTDRIPSAFVLVIAPLLTSVELFPSLRMPSPSLPLVVIVPLLTAVTPFPSAYMPRERSPLVVIVPLLESVEPLLVLPMP